MSSSCSLVLMNYIGVQQSLVADKQWFQRNLTLVFVISSARVGFF